MRYVKTARTAAASGTPVHESAKGSKASTAPAPPSGSVRRVSGVLERAEAEHAHARFAVGDSRELERMQVEREAAAGDERPEAGRDRSCGPSVTHLRAFVDARDLPVTDDVAEVRDDLGTEG